MAEIMPDEETRFDRGLSRGVKDSEVLFDR